MGMRRPHKQIAQLGGRFGLNLAKKSGYAPCRGEISKVQLLEKSCKDEEYHTTKNRMRQKTSKAEIHECRRGRKASKRQSGS